MDSRGGLVGTVAVVLLGGANIFMHAEEDLDEEMKVRVVEKLLPDEPVGAVIVVVLQVELSEDPAGVAL